MKAKAALSGLAVTALLITGLVSTGNADTWNKKTIVTFPESVELPGNVVVPAGKYVFKLADSSSNRHIVQVMSEAEDKVHATILAIPAERLEPAEGTILTFYETPKDQPMFIQKWFYPGQTIGNEFAYPKDRAAYIAKTSNSNVLLAPGEDNGEIGTYITPDSKEIARAEREAAHAVEKAADKSEGAIDTAVGATKKAASEVADKTEDVVDGAIGVTKRAATTVADKTEDVAEAVADALTGDDDDKAEPVAQSQPDPVRADSAADARAATDATTPATADPATADAEMRAAADARAASDADMRAAADQEQDALPQTASFLPLIGLAGLGLLGAASALRFRK
jgi:hypothetical protein